MGKSNIDFDIDFENADGTKKFQWNEHALNLMHFWWFRTIFRIYFKLELTKTTTILVTNKQFCSSIRIKHSEMSLSLVRNLTIARFCAYFLPSCIKWKFIFHSKKHLMFNILLIFIWHFTAAAPHKSPSHIAYTFD